MGLAGEGGDHGVDPLDPARIGTDGGGSEGRVRGGPEGREAREGLKAHEGRHEEREGRDERQGPPELQQESGIVLVDRR